MDAELILDCRNEHGEGILWNPADGRIWWTDIQGRALWWFEPQTGASGHRDLPDRLCTFAPRASGGWIMAFANSIELWSAAFETDDIVHSFEPENPETRTNDGRTDRAGAFIVGGMNEVTGAFDSTVIRVNPDGSVETLIQGVSCANSTCFSSDGETMFFADTLDKKIRAYPYASGVIGTPRILADMSAEPGLPDGSCVDAEGGIWNAEWEGGQVVRIGPDGAITHRVSLPVPKPTCCAFGGPELDTLYITTSRLMSTPEDLAAAPLSGSLFAVRPGIRGVEDSPFAG